VVLYALLSLALFSQPSVQTSLLSFTPNSAYKTLVLWLILTSLSCIGIPRQVVAFTCGYFFDVSLGILYATLSVTVAAYITYMIASLFQQSFIAVRYQKQLSKLNNFLSIDTFSKALIIRLLPVGSNFLTNILAGIANVPPRPYILGSCIGFIPQMVIFSIAGSGIKLTNSTHIILAAVLLVIASLLGWILYKKNKVQLT